jgi:PhzF family phenazine biosynthesis protein
MSRALDVPVVTVFPDGPGGGNPAPIVLDAAGLDDAAMQAVARSFGHESAFVVDPAGTGCDLALRFWVPNHEMSMCGHATVGTVWLLARLGRVPRPAELRVHTASGVVRARVDAGGGVTVSQPAGRVEPVDAAAVLAALGADDGALAGPVVNATTSRTKTLVPLADVTVLDGLHPDAVAVDAACEAIDSTGLYPYVVTGAREVSARQFPRAAGYPEDPATGVAAAALAFGLLERGLVQHGEVAPDERPIIIRQGRAMGRPSVIEVRFEVVDGSVRGCWLGGPVVLDG